MRKYILNRYLLGLIPVIILLAMTFLPLMTYFYGEEILLETKPVDPRDIFRGDYVYLSFDINDVHIDLFPEELKKPETFAQYKNKKLYAVLKKQGDFYEVERMSFEKPDHPYYLNAQIKFYSPLEKGYDDIQHVDYQIDRYFVPENTGKQLEELSQKGELAVKAKVRNGYPLLMEVLPK